MLREHGVHLELSEAAGQGDVGGRCDRLVSEHEHLVTDQSFARRAATVTSSSDVVEVDVDDLGADDRRDRAEVEGVGRAGDGGGGGGGVVIVAVMWAPGR